MSDVFDKQTFWYRSMCGPDFDTKIVITREMITTDIKLSMRELSTMSYVHGGSQGAFRLWKNDIPFYTFFTALSK